MIREPAPSDLTRMAMRTIDSTSLRPGSRLPRGLYTRQGIKLLGAGTVLTEGMCRMIGQSKWGPLFLASSAAELAGGSVLRLVNPLTDSAVTAALEPAGGAVGLAERHPSSPLPVVASEFAPPPAEDDQRLRAARMKIADQYVADLEHEWERLPRRIRPVPAIAWAMARTTEPRDQWPDESRLVEFREERVRRFRRAFSRILSGLPVDAAEIGGLVRELQSLQRTNTQRFTQLALLSPKGEDYLPEHCYAVSCLCVAIAARLRWSDEHVRLAGAAGLLADVGMGLVPADLRASGRRLGEVEVNRVRRHPTYSVVMLEAVEGLPEEVRQAAYQHHERENGSGYPRGLRGRAISDLARVVALADAFAAAASRRRHRAAKKPYEAIEELIRQAAAGVYDRSCARALVECVGLFPVGSHVLLSNRTPAVVVGVQPESIDRPIVRVLQRAASGSTFGITVYLADFPRNELWIAEPIDAPTDLVKEERGA